MILRRDHVAGGVFVAAGLFVLAASHDLPIGTLASPGAGMVPVLITVLMIVFGLIVMLQAGSGPRLAEISWHDFPHAAKVTAVAIVATALYSTLGFILTMALLLFALVYVIERRPLVTSLVFSISIPVTTFAIFEYLLKTPLERGLFWF